MRWVLLLPVAVVLWGAWAWLRAVLAEDKEVGS